jgi:hypothetical protein
MDKSTRCADEGGAKSEATERGPQRQNRKLIKKNNIVELIKTDQ